MSALLVFALLISQSLSDKLLERHHKREWRDDRCGHQTCPDGYSHVVNVYNNGHQEGIVCKAHRESFFRGWGYPYQIGDFDLAMFRPASDRCNKANPVLGCEFWGAVLYPKCPWGYENYLCCTCTAKCPFDLVERFLWGDKQRVCLLPCKD